MYLMFIFTYICAAFEHDVTQPAVRTALCWILIEILELHYATHHCNFQQHQLDFPKVRPIAINIGLRLITYHMCTYM